MVQKSIDFWRTQKVVLEALKSMVKAQERGDSDCFDFLCKLFFSFDECGSGGEGDNITVNAGDKVSQKLKTQLKNIN